MTREQQATTNKNKIPRHFLRITAQAEKATSASNTGDVLHIFKNDFGYLVSNITQNKYFYVAVSLLRDAEYFKILSIEQ